MPTLGPGELLVLVVAVASLTAALARRKGYGAGRFFVFGLVLAPLALVVALVLPDRSMRPAAARRGAP